ncbi:MAG: hypothetical protein AAFN30_11435, partial [Actinomycetota bacterium]
MFIVAGTAGGVGCTTVAAALALHSARRARTLLVDLDGDASVLLGARAPVVGLGEWSVAPHPPPDALRRLECQVGERLWLLAPGAEPLVLDGGRASLLARLLDADERIVVVDGGRLDLLPSPMAEAPGELVVVTRLCHLGLRRGRDAVAVLDRPVAGVVVVAEPGRILTVGDAGEALAAPVRVLLRWDPARLGHHDDTCDRSIENGHRIPTPSEAE